MPRHEIKGVDILNEGSVVAIIRYLDSHEEVKASDLKAVSGNYDRLKLLMERLSDLGLINIITKERPRLTFIYTLTQTGKKVAQKLNEIDKIIKKES